MSIDPLAPKPFNLFRLWPLVFFGFVAMFILPKFFAGMVATHGGVAAFASLIDAVNNRTIDEVGPLCSRSYLASHPLAAAKEGGVVGLPRGIHQNFQAWQDGETVLICPTNREGPVYRFIREDDAWKFDGPAGIMKAGEFIPGADLSVGP